MSGQAHALLLVLSSRGIAVDADTAQRIMREQDPERLQAWISRAATASTIDDVLDEE